MWSLLRGIKSLWCAHVMPHLRQYQIVTGTVGKRAHFFIVRNYVLQQILEAKEHIHIFFLLSLPYSATDKYLYTINRVKRNLITQIK